MRDREIDVGSWVEVRNRFNGRWAPGFVVDAVEESGYRLRRARDHQVLDEPVAAENVRPIPRMPNWQRPP